METTGREDTALQRMEIVISGIISVPTEMVNSSLSRLNNCFNPLETE
jgi:hypothetical protein